MVETAERAYKAGRQAKVPLIIGSNSAEIGGSFVNKSSSKEIEVAKQCSENLLDVRPHFCQVVEDIQHNGPPFFVIQR